MSIMLGNQTPEQIEKRLRISLSDEHKEELRNTWQQKAEHIADGKWHCFDLPFMIVCGDKPTAEKILNMLNVYDWLQAKCALQISWER